MRLLYGAFACEMLTSGRAIVTMRPGKSSRSTADPDNKHDTSTHSSQLCLPTLSNRSSPEQIKFSFPSFRPQVSIPNASQRERHAVSTRASDFALSCRCGSARLFQQRPCGAPVLVRRQWSRGCTSDTSSQR
ncbi:hypothetical protein BKA66DRAFT_163666 [Pyrenochaeta sp. MPI-SDFR-AT-0127]|nr:hypothetical protein BKA66DRAFT_163666 [Pyrenochaeta sp. MPI-SDFR-AT-0127]